MVFGLTFSLALIVLGAVVAYVGDRVGMKVGRRRLTLFGLRPKYTSIIITILTGALIVVFTMTTMVLLSQDVKTALFGMEELRLTISTLEADIEQRNEELGLLTGQLRSTQEDLAFTRKAVDEANRNLQQARLQVESLNRQIQGLTGEKRDLVEEKQKLMAENQHLREINDRLKDENASLSEEKRDLTLIKQDLLDQNGRLRLEIRSLMDDIAELKAERDRVEEEKEFLSSRIDHLKELGATITSSLYASLMGVREGSIIFNTGEVVIGGTIRGNQAIDEIKSKLGVLLSLAARVAVERGAQADAEGNVLLLQKATRDRETGAYRFLTLDEILTAVAEVIASQVGDGTAIVQVVAVRNTVEDEPVFVDFELFTNRLIFSRGEVLIRRVIDGNAPRSEIFSQLLTVLESDVNGIARDHGMLPSAAGTFGEIKFGRLYEICERISSMKTPCEVSVVAASDTWTTGPLELDFHITPVSSLPSTSYSPGL